MGMGWLIGIVVSHCDQTILGDVMIHSIYEISLEMWWFI